MALEVGSRLGHYDVTALIGEGGMGQVYQATDTKLNREVALKILPEAFAADPDRLARFQREAQVLASLNHPGIAQIHGIEDSEGTKALVLELVEGPTLADRIAHGPIPVDEALPIAKQIAEALEAAHEAGVIHRDLKPANIKVRDDGTVKVLDFGLAKTLDTTPEGDPSQSPTLTAAATQMGVIMGTAAYMSPEQARGKPVDKRADIWAFGVVLFEMLTGKRAFEGEDVSVTLADVIRADPGWGALPTDVSPTLANYLRQCLHKEPRRRLRDIGDMRLAMEGVFDTEASGVRAESERRSRVGVATLICAVVASSLVTVVVTRNWVVAEPRLVSRVHMSTGVAAPMIGGAWDSGNIALTPDGRILVYVGIEDGGIRQLYRRPLDSFDATPIAGTVGASAPFFSPDGNEVAFVANGELRRVSLASGLPTTVVSVTGSFRGGSWGDDGTIVFGVAESGMWRVSALGGQAEQFTTLTGHEVLHAEPDLHTGKRLLLFTVSGAEGDRLVAVDLDTEERTDLGEGFSPRLVSDDQLLFLREDSVWVAPFDAEAVRLTQAAVPIADEGRVFAVAREGDSLAYLDSEITSRLVWVGRVGHTTELDFEPERYRLPRLSPNGEDVAIEILGSGLWVLNLERGTRTLIDDDRNAYYPLWRPDGRHVSYTIIRRGDSGIYQRVADGSAGPELLYGGDVVGGSWSSDGSLALWDYPPVTRTTGATAPIGALGDRDIGVMSAAMDVSMLTDTPSNERSPRVSPDGQWLAFISDESGRDEVYLQAHPRGGGRTVVSTSGGNEPVWSKDGRELFFRAIDEAALMVVRIAVEPTLRVTAPDRLFTGVYRRAAPLVGVANYDVSADGQRFLMLKSDRPALEVNVVLNWREELRQRMLLD